MAKVTSGGCCPDHDPPDRFPCHTGGTGVADDSRVMRIPDMRRCEASLSAAYYARKSKARGAYDHDRWLWLDGGHERCRNKVKTLRRGADGWYGVCGLHDLMARRHDGLFYPYMPPGRGCRQPCCAEVWQVSTWTPSKRLKEKASASDEAEADDPVKVGGSDERLLDLYRQAADTTLLMLDPGDADGHR